MKAVELVQAIELSLCDLLGWVLYLYKTTGQFSASVRVFLIPLWLFKYLNLLVFSSSHLSESNALSLVNFPSSSFFFVSSAPFISSLSSPPHQHISVSGHNVSVSSCLLASVFCFFIYSKSVLLLCCPVLSCRILSCHLNKTSMNTSCF